MKKFITIGCLIIFSVSSVLALNLGKIIKSAAKMDVNEVVNVINDDKQTKQSTDKALNSKDATNSSNDEDYDKAIELAKKDSNLLSKLKISGYILGEKFSNKGENIANISTQKYLKVLDSVYADYHPDFENNFDSVKNLCFYNKIAYGKNMVVLLDESNKIDGIILNTTNKAMKEYAKSIISSTKQKNIAKKIKLESEEINYDYSINVYENFKVLIIEEFKAKKINGKETMSKVGEFMFFSKVTFSVPPKVYTIDSYEYASFVDFINKYKVGTKLEISDKEIYREEQKIGNTKYDVFSVNSFFSKDENSHDSNIWVNQKTGILERLSIPTNNNYADEDECKYMFYKIYKFNYYYDLNLSNFGLYFIGKNNSVFLTGGNKTFDFFLNKDVCEKFSKNINN